MKKLHWGALGIGALILLVLGIRFSSSEDTWICTNDVWTKHGNPSSPAPTSGCGVTAQAPVTDTDITGQLIRDLPGMKQNAWYLIYEKPGAPALQAELVFNEKSTCFLGDTQGACPDILLLSSNYTNITGVTQSDGTVLVVRAGPPERQ
jgi:hypothetical protein